MNEHELLNQQMENSSQQAAIAQILRNPDGVEPSSPLASSQSTEFRQWQVGPNDTFRPAGVTQEALPVGVYRFGHDPYGIYTERIKVVAARAIYIAKIAPQLTDKEQRRWNAETEGLSIAHLRELAAAVLCLGQPYEEVVDRLRSMRALPKDRDGMGALNVGFGGQAGR